ncbi:MAG: tetratricopeptide repeat protein [Actinomycetota bacterium]
MSDAPDPTKPDLPTGTVTFLFTDIEGSTRLLDRLGPGYPEVLETHQRLLRDAFGRRGGIEITTEGDSFFVVFASAPEAVAAAVEAQRAVGEHQWHRGAAVRVRMGVHTGEGVRGADNYVGVDVHRAARIAGAGHGGQIVTSAATAALVANAEGVALRDLGEHRLKDLPQPEHLFQVVAEGLETEFPPLRSMDARPNNLPLQLTSFVGRSREIDEVERLIDRTRLLTLTGPGGTGKSRLSIQVASKLLPRFEDGAFFVPLAPITDPGMVVLAVAQALGLRETSDRPPIEGVIEYLRDKELLLLLDNFEQVLDAAPEVGQLLSATERVWVMATSREPLGLHGEAEYPVPPLGLPDPEHLPALDRLSQFEGVALFIERAEAVKPGFAVTNENAPAIAEICARLDGLPLAIELAAARVKILDPQAMLARLEHALTFLTHGARDVPARQQTLRDAIAWSFDLLDEEERRLFGRLAVFVGGFALEAVDAVANPGGELGVDTLDVVASLANKSLLRQMEGEPGEPGFFMLETIREYASERLAGDPAAEEVRRRHAAFYLDLAERAAPELTGPDQVHWLDMLATRHDNLRAALAWAVERGEAETALRLGAALWRFWQMRWNLREGLDRIGEALDLPGATDHPEARVAALEGAGGLAYWMGDDSAGPLYEESLRIRRELGDRRGIAEAAYNLSFVGVFLRRQQEGAIERSMELLEESLAIFQELGDERGLAKTLWGIGDALYEAGRLAEAESYLRRAAEMHRRLGDRFGLAWDLFVQAMSVQKRGRLPEVRPLFEESLAILGEAKDMSGIPLVLGGMASLAADQGEGERAVLLAGAAAGLEATYGGGLTRINEEVERWEDRRRELVPDEAQYERLWAQGRAMTVEEAVATALGREADASTIAPHNQEE